jgi:hypothetical protein
MAKKTTPSKDCTHEFVATGDKGVWEVQAISLNKRGKPRTQRVNTTVFQCKKCGQEKEYPDTWEKNYLLPRPGTTPRVKKAKAKTRKKTKTGA